jgi:DNA-binding transcriptional LysR family regulator
VQRLAANLKAGDSAKELRILTVLALSYEILPYAIKLFRVKHPDVAITIKALHSPQIVAALVLQEADVGFLFSPVVHSALAQEHLADGRMVCLPIKGSAVGVAGRRPAQGFSSAKALHCGNSAWAAAKNFRQENSTSLPVLEKSTASFFRAGMVSKPCRLSAASFKSAVVVLRDVAALQAAKNCKAQRH